MKKYKLKYLIIIFSVLMGIQFIIGLVDILFSQASSGLASFTAMLITICSFPLSLINSDLPFFVSENFLMIGLYWVINLLIQAVVVYGVLLVIQKIKQSNDAIL